MLFQSSSSFAQAIQISFLPSSLIWRATPLSTNNRKSAYWINKINSNYEWNANDEKELPEAVEYRCSGSWIGP